MRVWRIASPRHALDRAMAVPSVLMPEEHNVQLNPNHADYARVTMGIVRPFNFDERMLK